MMRSLLLETTLIAMLKIDWERQSLEVGDRKTSAGIM